MKKRFRKRSIAFPDVIWLFTLLNGADSSSLRNADGRPVLLDIPERLEFVDAPARVDDLKRYRYCGYRMTGNRIAGVTDHTEDLIEVHPPSRGSVDLGGLTVERCPPAPAIRGTTRSAAIETRTSQTPNRPSSRWRASL